MMTGNLTSIARPYAQAAFEYASAKNAFRAWDELLQTAAIVAVDPTMIHIMGNPKVTNEQLAELFIDVLASELDTEKKNFIQLLSEHRRFAVLPAIAAQFKKYCAELEKKITVDVVSATALSAEQKEKLTQALAKRLKLQVTLNPSVDPELIGGVVVRAGDQVIDGSVRGKLNRLVEFI